MEIISLTGAKRSGKNTFATYLKEAAEADGRTVELASWAHLLKQVAVNSLGINEDADEWAERTKERHMIKIIDPEYDMVEDEISVRRFLQNLGTQACRELFGMNFWIDQFWNHFERTHDPHDPNGPPDLLIFTDTRFDNEAFTVEHLGGINVEIVKDGLTSNDGHESESGVSRENIYDTIWNDSDLSALRVKAQVNYKKWMSDRLG